MPEPALTEYQTAVLSMLGSGVALAAVAAVLVAITAAVVLVRGVWQ